MPDGELHSDAGAHAEAEDVDLVDAEMPEQRRGVVGHLLVA